MSGPDEIFDGITSLTNPWGIEYMARPGIKEANVRYFPDRHFEPVEEGGVRSYVARVMTPYHQGWVTDLIAWPIDRKRFDKWATLIKRAGMFAIRRLAPAFNGGADPFFVYRTPHGLLRSEEPDLWLQRGFVDQAFGAVILNVDADRQLDRVQTIIAEGEEHACQLSERLERPVRFVHDDFYYRGDWPIDRWLRHHTVTVS
jgi:hypothetical protein